MQETQLEQRCALVRSKRRYASFAFSGLVLMRWLPTCAVNTACFADLVVTLAAVQRAAHHSKRLQWPWLVAHPHPAKTSSTRKELCSDTIGQNIYSALRRLLHAVWLEQQHRSRLYMYSTPLLLQGESGGAPLLVRQACTKQDLSSE